MAGKADNKGQNCTSPLLVEAKLKDSQGMTALMWATRGGLIASRI